MSKARIKCRMFQERMKSLFLSNTIYGKIDNALAKAKEGKYNEAIQKEEMPGVYARAVLELGESYSNLADNGELFANLDLSIKYYSMLYPIIQRALIHMFIP